MYMRRRLVSRLRSRVFWEAGRDNDGIYMSGYLADIINISDYSVMFHFSYHIVIACVVMHEHFSLYTHTH